MIIVKNSWILFFSLISIFILSNCKKDAPTDAPEIITKIAGKVIDGKSNQPITGVQVTTNPVTSSVITGSDGNYTIPDVNPGQYTITAKKEGYSDNFVSVSVTEGNTVNADIKMLQIQPEIEVTPLILDFNIDENNMTFSIFNKTKVGNIAWQITNNQQWMTITPISGSTSNETDIITVSINRSNIDYGNHSGLITIESNYGNKQISVIVVKSNPNAPQISVTPLNLDFDSSQTTLQLTIRNTGANVLNWAAISNANWLTISTTSGGLTSSSPTVLTVAINRVGLNPNVYHGAINFTSNGGSQSVIVQMKVSSFSQNTGQYSLDDNTLVLYHFDETSGDDVYDATNWKHDGGTFNSIVDNGKFLKGRRFGVDAQNNIGFMRTYFPNPSPLNFGLEKFTIEGWIYLNEYLGTKFIQVYNNNIAIHYWGKDLMFFVSNEMGTEITWTVENVLNVYEWTHIALTYDGSKTRTFINGQLKSERNFSGKVSGPTSRYLDIYGRNTIIDEIRISDKAREVNEFNLNKQL
ncbi:MAG: carboxypeptidase regulatory-like domain-containing protein, partial [Ignavibacteriaceae bacterium]|nr:carboxypeptidase regulatory-like domain-containing protein [Ignavibacteriaceae bacterium]